MSKEEKYMVMFVNVMMIMLIDIFTAGTLTYYFGTELIRFVFPFVLFTTQGILMLLTEAVKHNTLRKLGFKC